MREVEDTGWVERRKPLLSSADAGTKPNLEALIFPVNFMNGVEKKR
ncbi:hypothetical protein LARV_03908 [Longilinea arvoryzae]|uniref:Uncharacterized protein n=1 Tax=Longilinea arvoryzae TaxID=360412 RepID=A0A0K8MZN8_9CHLR|nr:hypothetical protein LARV_03908 [Longilinea arvoryzae]